MDTTSVELNAEQVLYLKRIYLKRRNLWRGAFSGSVFLFIASNLNIFGEVIRVRGKASIQEQTSLFEIIVVGLLCLLIFAFIIIYFLKIRPLRKDMDTKSGVIHYLPVIRKSSFPLVGTYFLFFDSELIPNKEVNEAEFARYQEGENYPVLMSNYSRIVIDEFENYELM